MIVDIPNEADVEYTVNRDDPEDAWVNVYHFRVPEEYQGEGIASTTLRRMLETAQGKENVNRLVVTMQVPESDREKILHIFNNKFEFDHIRYPIEKRRYENPVLEARKMFSS